MIVSFEINKSPAFQSIVIIQPFLTLWRHLLQQTFLNSLIFRQYRIVPAKSSADFSGRREDLEDLISDPLYFQAIFHSLGCVKDLYRSQAELGMANEAIAGEFIL